MKPKSPEYVALTTEAKMRLRALVAPRRPMIIAEAKAL